MKSFRMQKDCRDVRCHLIEMVYFRSNHIAHVPLQNDPMSMEMDSALEEISTYRYIVYRL